MVLALHFHCFGFLGSCLLPQGRRQSHSRRHERFMRLPQHLTAHHETLPLEYRLDLLEVIESTHDLGPFPALTLLLQPLLQCTPQQ